MPIFSPSNFENLYSCGVDDSCGGGDGDVNSDSDDDGNDDVGNDNQA